MAVILIVEDEDQVRVLAESCLQEQGHRTVSAATAEEAERELSDFAQRWNAKYPTIAAMWQRNWQRVIPFYAFPEEIRKIIYTTNAVESLNMTLRKALKTRGAFPSEEAALKVMYLALRNVIAKWQRPLQWKAALNRFTMLWEDRIQAVRA